MVGTPASTSFGISSSVSSPLKSVHTACMAISGASFPLERTLSLYSRDSIMSIPGSLVQKSTMVVVPPLRATQVVSYPALVVTPSVFNASKCEWLSTPPGSTYLPAASITVSASTSMWLAIIDIFSSSIRISAANSLVEVTIVPFFTRVFI